MAYPHSIRALVVTKHTKPLPDTDVYKEYMVSVLEDVAIPINLWIA